MSEYNQQSKVATQTKGEQKSIHKSNGLQNRRSGMSSLSNMLQLKFQIPLEQTSQYSSLSNPRINISNNSLQDNNLNSKLMTNSSMFDMGSKSSVGRSLFQMARKVEEVRDEESLQIQKEKNKYSFLQQAYKSNSNIASELKQSGIIAMGASSILKQGDCKIPSFLKKDTKSAKDSHQKQPQGAFKKAKLCKSIAKRICFDLKSEISEKKTPQSDIKNPDNNLQLKLTSSQSPKESSVSKNQSTNEPKQSSSNNNTLVGPQMLPHKSTRKGSIILNQKKFYTPTEKNSKFSTSNFIYITEKYTSTYNGAAKTDNKSQFLHVQQRPLEQSTSPKDGQKKTQIPSFIKFKEKRNEILKKQTQRNQTLKHSSNQVINRNSTNSERQEIDWTVQDFEIKDRLGKGSFGEVYLARQKASGFFCVLKKLSKKKIKLQNTQQLIVRQIKIQSFLAHRHVTNLYGFFDDQQYIYLVMEYMSDGSLAQRFNWKKIPEKQVAAIIKQICEALRYIHIQNIIHRDIKPDNIFIHEGYIKIGDFGCSVFSNSKRNTILGSWAYFSPEQLKNEFYDEKIDIWSVGILCYQLLTGSSPFEEDIMKIAKQQKEAKLPQLCFPSKVELTEEAKDFTRCLLKETPETRLSINQCLRHAFILNNCNPTQVIINFSQFDTR